MICTMQNEPANKPTASVSSVPNAIAGSPTFFQRLLGFFVLIQLAFIVLANVLAFFPMPEPDPDELTDSRGPASLESAERYPEAFKLASKAILGYGQATGQIQAWWLFAPSFPPQATFPVVDLRWVSVDGGETGVRLPSRFEPENPGSYVRLPGSNDRYYHYEARLTLLLGDFSEKSLALYPDAWRHAFADRVRRQWKSMRAYLRSRVHEYQAKHPDKPEPTEVILSVRIYTTPPPGAAPFWDLVIEEPLAKWLPAMDGQSDYLPIEAFDPVSQRFVQLARKEQVR